MERRVYNKAERLPFPYELRLPRILQVLIRHNLGGQNGNVSCLYLLQYTNKLTHPFRTTMVCQTVPFQESFPAQPNKFKQDRGGLAACNMQCIP